SRSRASVLGVFGQNGSGKSVVIEALELLRLALAGEAIPAAFARGVRAGASSASFAYVIRVAAGGAAYEAAYALEIAAQQDAGAAAVKDESLVFSAAGGGRRRRKAALASLAAAAPGRAFGPAAKYRLLAGSGRRQAVALLSARGAAQREGRSFIFSEELRAAALEQPRQGGERLLLMRLLESLRRFGREKLFVLGPRFPATLDFGMIPGAAPVPGQLRIPLEGSASLPAEAVPKLRELVASLSGALREIVPPLELEVQADVRAGEPEAEVRLAARRGRDRIPLALESDGVKKLAALIHYLAAAYNDASATLAVDNLDSCVYEHLLGELLWLFSEKAEGQLIFTSNNFRPLELLDEGLAAFTTTDPGKKYTGLAGVKKHGNLRDVYYRDIELRAQGDEVCAPVCTPEIAAALLCMGRDHGHF
ncbi:MAG: ATP-binding protein, partial [Duodenibacillus sp.]|nr:ATP-binding protein [Duodenibacillus sp.]